MSWRHASAGLVVYNKRILAIESTSVNDIHIKSNVTSQASKTFDIRSHSCGIARISTYLRCLRSSWYWSRWNRDSSASVVTGLTTVVPYLAGERYFSSLHNPLSLMLPDREADHSPPSSFEVKWWSYTSTSVCIFMAQCLMKYRNSFRF
jgi:hypothetical protein